MNRQIIKSLTFGAAGAMTCAGAYAQTAQQKARPNVIVILADDLGYGDLACYGAKNVKTPNVDALASSGVRFTNCHATAATSTPSRYSLLTGQYAWRKPALFVTFQLIQEKITPLKWEDTDNEGIENELEQYSH